MKKLLTALALSALLVPAAAHADDDTQTKVKLMAQIDVYTNTCHTTNATANAIVAIVRAQNKVDLSVGDNFKQYLAIRKTFVQISIRRVLLLDALL